MASKAQSIDIPPRRPHAPRARDASRQRPGPRQRDVRRTGFLTPERRMVLGRILRWLGGVAVLLVALAAMAAFASYDQYDPSMNTGTGNAARNLLGVPGAFFSAFFLQWWGLAALALPLALGAWGLRVIVADAIVHWKSRSLAAVAATWLGSLAIGGWAEASQPAFAASFSGVGGAIGTVFNQELLASWAAGTGFAPWTWTINALLGLFGLVAMAFAMGVTRGEVARLRGVRMPSFGRSADEALADWADADEDAQAPVATRKARSLPAPERPRTEPKIGAPAPMPLAERQMPRVSKPKGAAMPANGRQEKLALGDTYQLPSIDLLQAVPRKETAAIDPQALVQNARLLESILEDFGVQGEIPQVHPGPVVTLYELEPAPGIKASRVIGLADDIARSMSAISARVAVVPGRNVIGIELPNRNRETVVLRELMASPAFEGHKGALPLILGKDLSGEPVVTDLAPMPHLLIAGTTGSGKSVGLNAMILSLLYRLTPDQCRMIMIDPKMLELSVYDNIPHLLAPVVTEPKTAIVALKWAVKEMDDRYRKMSKLAVRNLAAFNEKIAEAKAKNRSLLRRVQTGFDPQTGEPVYEDQTFDFEPLPLIVVVVDELADLMMVAGKEIEQLIQRLAQKARAAGIHIIVATQRPSVDVITGVIKANLPTRVSFQVTSKIDSRTILNEQGAEQLLGKGDMLFMQGGKQILRVHGPLVLDEEVERVADFWRSQGRPDYVDAVTSDPDEEGGFDEIMGGGDGDDLYRRAVELVAREQKCSTSFIQRHLAIGYNRAARIVDQMEKAGLVGPPNHVGKREVLIDPDGNRIG